MTDRPESTDDRLLRLRGATEDIRAPGALADAVMGSLDRSAAPPAASAPRPSRALSSHLSRWAPAALVAGVVAAAAFVALADLAQRTVDEGAIAGVVTVDHGALAVEGGE